MEKIKIGGIMQSTGRSLIRIPSAPNREGTAGDILEAIGERDINLELVVQGSCHEGHLNFALVVEEKNAANVLDFLDEHLSQTGGPGIEHTADVAIISVFGPHLREKPRVPGQMFKALGRAGLVPLAIATSISSVSCVLPGRDLERAVNSLLQVFDAPFQVKNRPESY